MTQILLVDDSQAMRRYVARALEMTGMDLDIYEAEDGREALERAIGIRPRVIITDLSMPEMSGEELMAAIRKLPALKDTAVVVLSADRSIVRSEELREAGAVAYVTKPVSPEGLRRTLMTILEVSN